MTKFDGADRVGPDQAQLLIRDQCGRRRPAPGDHHRAARPRHGGPGCGVQLRRRRAERRWLRAVPGDFAGRRGRRGGSHGPGQRVHHLSPNCSITWFRAGCCHRYCPAPAISPWAGRSLPTCTARTTTGANDFGHDSRPLGHDPGPRRSGGGHCAGAPRSHGLDTPVTGLPGDRHASDAPPILAAPSPLAGATL